MTTRRNPYDDYQDAPPTVYASVPADRLHERIAEGAAAQAELTRINSAAAALPALRDEAARRERKERRTRQRAAEIEAAERQIAQAREFQRQFAAVIEQMVPAAKEAFGLAKQYYEHLGLARECAVVVNKLDYDDAIDGLNPEKERGHILGLAATHGPNRAQRVLNGLNPPLEKEGLAEYSVARALAETVLNAVSPRQDLPVPKAENARQV